MTLRRKIPLNRRTLLQHLARKVKHRREIHRIWARGASPPFSPYPLRLHLCPLSLSFLVVSVLSRHYLNFFFCFLLHRRFRFVGSFPDTGSTIISFIFFPQFFVFPALFSFCFSFLVLFLSSCLLFFLFFLHPSFHFPLYPFYLFPPSFFSLSSRSLFVFLSHPFSLCLFFLIFIFSSSFLLFPSPLFSIPKCNIQSRSNTWLPSYYCMF